MATEQQHHHLKIQGPQGKDALAIEHLRVSEGLSRLFEIHVRFIANKRLSDLEGQVRRILDYCGLEFEPGCVEFHKTKREVRTASSEQVRQPINTKGLEQWKAYDAWLDPLREALGPVLDDWRRDAKLDIAACS